MNWCVDKLEDQVIVGLVAALGGCFTSVCGVIPGVLGCIGSRWLFLVEGWVVLLVYPPLEVGPKYALGAVEALWREVSWRSPFELLGGSLFNQVRCCVVAFNMVEARA